MSSCVHANCIGHHGNRNLQHCVKLCKERYKFALTAVVRTHPMQARCCPFLLALSEAVGMVAGSPAAGSGLRGGGGGRGRVVAAGGQSFAPCEGQHVVSVYHCDT